MEHTPEKEVILSVKDLVVKFNLRGQVLTAIRGISMDLYKGESLAIVGESGSGKSVFTKTFMGLLDKNGWVDSGSILYKGHDLAKYKTEKEWDTIRGSQIAMVFQDPMTSLNPLKTIGKQIQEAFELHGHMKRPEAKQATIRLLADVGIPEPEKRYKQYPHEFSGGMRQRVVIAIAMACNPEILICDEPTTALDVTIQAQILDLLRNLQTKYSLTVIYITHDRRYVRRRHRGDRHLRGSFLRSPASLHLGAALLSAPAGRQGQGSVFHQGHPAQSLQGDQGRRLRAPQPRCAGGGL